MLPVLVGKTVKNLAKMRGGGSALPGLVVEKLWPGFMPRALGRLPLGVMVVSGTNGKTSTTKIISELLESQGLRVFTNSSGANFARGVISEILERCDRAGNLEADIAVLELDEGHTKPFIAMVKPDYAVLTNVFVDQVDRFADVTVTAALLQNVAEPAQRGVIFNAEDPFLTAAVRNVLDADPGRKVFTFGLGKQTSYLFPRADQGEVEAPDVERFAKTVTLLEISGSEATFLIDGQEHRAKLKLQAEHNFFNAAAALAASIAVLSARSAQLDSENLVRALETITPASGRAETVEISGDAVELLMAKNPASYRASLRNKRSDAKTLIVVNDSESGSSDVSWLEPVDFSMFSPGEELSVSGHRAAQVAEILRAKGLSVTSVEPDIDSAVEIFIANTQGNPKQIFGTYSATLRVRRVLMRLIEDARER